jgi:hypothetical protein
MTDQPLSPAAQAVLDAAAFAEPGFQSSIAAALRAAADQVVPAAPEPLSIMGPVYVAQVEKQRKIRAELLAIAAELDGTTQHNPTRGTQYDG